MDAAVVTLSSCFGCSFEMLNLRKDLMEIFKRIDFVDFKLLREENKEKDYDVIFVEGGISRKDEIKKIKKLRKRSKTMVALGACACNGCVMTVKNYAEKAEEQVYGKNLYGSVPVTGINEYVKVDYYLRGCPFFRHELVSLAKSFLLKRVWREKSYSVCIDCRKNDKDCLLDRGVLCLGPISRAGCKAICPSNDHPCVGCRGLSEDKNLEEFFQRARKLSSKKEIKKKLEMYNLYEEIRGTEAWKKLR